MWIKPTISSQSYIALRQECNDKKLKLWAANNQNHYYEIGGYYAVYCKFSNMLIHSADTLQEIANYLKIGGNYE